MGFAEDWMRPTLFQHTAARRRLTKDAAIAEAQRLFQHTAARRRLSNINIIQTSRITRFQHTAARRRLRLIKLGAWWRDDVSTHSRPKAAERNSKSMATRNKCFNTQPPEGG